MAGFGSKLLNAASYISPAALATRGVTSGYAKPILTTAGTIGGIAAGSLVGAPGVGASLGSTAGLAAGTAADNYFNPQQASGQMRQDGSGSGGGGGGDPWNGYSGYNTQLANISPEQITAQNWLLGQGMQNANFQGIEDKANRDFHTKTVPSITERFTAFNGPGTRSSSGFANALGQAGSDLQSQLAALRGEYGMSQLQQGLQPRYENLYTPPQGGFAQSAAQDIPKYAELLGNLFQEYQKNKLGGGS